MPSVAAGPDRNAVRDELRRVGRGAVTAELCVAMHPRERALGDRGPGLVRPIQQLEIAGPRWRARQAPAQATDEDPLRTGNQHEILGMMRAADEMQLPYRRAALLSRRRGCGPNQVHE